MEQYIYKYFSFPSFVDMVQRKCLHFVLPSKWEDPEEVSFVYKWGLCLDENMNRWMTLLLVNRVYAQSWTYLSDSDAMWRIYSYDRKSLRIKIDTSSLRNLDSVRMFPVQYNNSLISYSSENLSHSELLQRYISQKRKAFEHEKEVRLLFIDRIDPSKVEPAIRNIYYFLKGQTGDVADLDISKINIDEMREYINYSNLNEKKASYDVSFEHIPNFIKGVMVHPQASDWYVNTIRMYCDINSITFEGKSQLYK